MNERQKKKQMKMRNKRLLKRYPFLAPCKRWGDTKYDYTYTEIDMLDTGWRKAFGNLLLEDLRDALIKANFLHQFRFTEIKEKWGVLRLDCNGAPREVYDVLSKYEYISGYVCIQCGSPYACVVNDYGRYLSLCRKCWEKNNDIREKNGYKIVSWEEASDKEDTGLPNSYSDGDITYDISETANKIRKRYEKISRI